MDISALAIALIVLFVAVLFLAFVILLSKRYKRCPSNCVLVIYGKVGGRGYSAKCIHGGAAFVWPLFQDFAYLSLEPSQIEIPLKDALSMENIRVNVPSVFTVAIGTEDAIMQNAAIRLLGLNTQQIKKQAEDIIFGQLRQVIASMGIEDINRDRDKFLHNIQTSLEPELRKIGLVLINVNITDITDESGYIEAIGRKAASQAIQQARGDVAEQEKLGETRVAEADRDKAVNVADAQKQRNIGIRSAQKEQAVRVAELDKEQQVGEKSAQFQREAQVKDAEREKRVAVADAEATAVEGENLAKARVANAQAGLQVKEAEAYQLGETRTREAEAAVLEAQNLAMAKAAIAEAERIEQERRAQLEAPAKAEKAQTIVDAEASAERQRIEAQGEAAAIFAKLEAEARGQFETLAKKGEGLRRIVEACGGSQEAFQILMLEHLDNLAEASAKAISNIKFDKIVVWEGGAKDGASSTANFLHNMARTLPPVLQTMRDIGGVEIPEYLAKLAPEDGAPPGKPDAARAPSRPKTAAGPSPDAKGQQPPPKPAP
ncbi:MAG TPA: flotillin family protein [Candidatus Hydrogenedentes bacterium]|nr:flotillin family protein [Candidatus Hydrogenedentota bacterium]